ncbi:MAG: tRNA uridine-5-carboxymethylaminomethyl(34) synthesis GTPase MnmE [Clostridia bacterium]|nr:tRNA uridine-5-carboxymethylaminomethyl(34) synthesis GTPase MnmE [Clostridia bacterium]
MLSEKNSTIVALSTSLGTGAISIVRLSGEKAIEIADKLFSSLKNKKPSEFESRKLELGFFNAQNFKEQILCVVFRAPFSYTGENLVEFQCHGGVRIAEGVINACIDCGARLAESGEFTKRAFINGKISLDKAEGMMDMINAESEAEIRAGFNLLGGALGKVATASQSALVDLLSDIEVSFDYPEEDIEYTTKEKAKNKIAKINEDILSLISTSNAGRQIKDGISLLILGEPNVGKSSLLNSLTKSDRAIVTSIAGTTRDTIEETLVINGLKYKIIDTAGIHETEDEVEKIGINRAKSLISGADMCLCLVDCSKEENDKDREVLSLTKNSKRIIVGNKIDKTNKPRQNADIYISTKSEKDVNNLKDLIYSKTADKNITSGLVITNLRHLDALKRAQKHLENALLNIEFQTLDLISVDLNLAYSALGEITGSTTGEDIINSIFSKFCLGK